jgi:hypothetical protein
LRASRPIGHDVKLSDFGRTTARKIWGSSATLHSKVDGTLSLVPGSDIEGITVLSADGRSVRPAESPFPGWQRLGVRDAGKSSRVHEDKGVGERGDVVVNALEYKQSAGPKDHAAGLSVRYAGDGPLKLEAKIPGCGGVLDDEDYRERIDKGVGSVEREDKIDLNRRGKGYRVCGYGPYCPEEEEE